VLASRRLFRDRESLKPVVENVYLILEEWDAWLTASEQGTEEDLQEHLERVAYAMAALKEAAGQYDAGVQARLAEELERREQREREKETEKEQEEVKEQIKRAPRKNSQKTQSRAVAGKETLH
jgi:ribosomal protein L12E/L44/L45/RPP1/RPP2